MARGQAAESGQALESGGPTGSAPQPEVMVSEVEPTPPTGTELALQHLRETFDPDAGVMWRTRGAKNTKQTEIVGIMCEIGDGARRIVVAVGLASGAFKLFSEVPGRATDTQIEALAKA